MVDISISQVGSTAVRTVVRDLQAPPGTGASIAAIDELQIGPPAAMEVTGIDAPGRGRGSINLEQTADGQELGVLTVDHSMLAWRAMDRVTRELAGQEPGRTFWDEATAATLQVVTEDDVPSYVDAAHLAFPDRQERSTQRWTAR